eukprot:scaffold204808_cov29-Tisochrysis_lutea.AAC.1
MACSPRPPRQGPLSLAFPLTPPITIDIAIALCATREHIRPPKPWARGILTHKGLSASRLWHPHGSRGKQRPPHPHSPLRFHA